jgi:hypothetical protein
MVDYLDEKNDIKGMSLDNFLRSYHNFIQTPVHSALLHKCMSDYDGTPSRSSHCFSLKEDANGARNVGHMSTCTKDSDCSDTNMRCRKSYGKEGRCMTRGECESANRSDAKAGNAKATSCNAMPGYGPIYDRNGGVSQISGVSSADMEPYYPAEGGDLKLSFDQISRRYNGSSVELDTEAITNDVLDFRTTMGTKIEGFSGGPNYYESNTLDEYIKKYDENIDSEHKKLLEKRSNLDNKMRDLYGAKGDPDLNLDISVYSTMLFTITTTSLLYYLFVKI